MSNIKSFYLQIDRYDNRAMNEDHDEATAKILEEVAKNVRTFGLDSDHLPTVIRDDSGNKVGTITVYVDD